MSFQVRLTLFVILLLGCDSFSPAMAQSDVDANGGRQGVVIPVVVRDRNGNVVTDLTSSSFEVQDKGKPQTISAFELMKFGAPGLDGQPIRRHTAYLLDDMQVTELGDFRSMVDSTGRHLVEIDPGDYVTVVTASCSAAKTDWTNDSARIKELLLSLKPHAPGPSICLPAQTELVQFSLIQILINHLRTLPGLRDIVVVSPGLNAWVTRGLNQVPGLIESANQAGVVISGVQMNRTEEGAGIDTAGGELSNLCPSTGGLFIEHGNDIDGAFRKLRLPDAVYFLTLSANNVKPDGAVHHLKVVVKDPRKLTVQARKAYTAPKSAGR